MSDAGGADGVRFRPPSAEDTQRLLLAVQDWAQRAFPAPPSGHGGPECQWCPLCQIASALRGEHPELTERLGEAGAAITQAVRAARRVGRRGRRARTPRAPTRPRRRTPAPQPGRGPARACERITLDDPDDHAGRTAREPRDRGRHRRHQDVRGRRRRATGSVLDHERRDTPSRDVRETEDVIVDVVADPGARGTTSRPWASARPGWIANDHATVLFSPHLAWRNERAARRARGPHRRAR